MKDDMKQCRITCIKHALWMLLQLYINLEQLIVFLSTLQTCSISSWARTSLYGKSDLLCMRSRGNSSTLSVYYGLALKRWMWLLDSSSHAILHQSPSEGSVHALYGHNLSDDPIPNFGAFEHNYPGIPDSHPIWMPPGWQCLRSPILHVHILKHPCLLQQRHSTFMSLQGNYSAVLSDGQSHG